MSPLHYYHSTKAFSRSCNFPAAFVSPSTLTARGYRTIFCLCGAYILTAAEFSPCPWPCHPGRAIIPMSSASPNYPHPGGETPTFAARSLNVLLDHGSLLGSILSIAMIAVVMLLVFSRLLFHPLARVPGPPLAALSTWYGFYYDVIRGGIYVKHVEEIHARHSTAEQGRFAEGRLTATRIAYRSCRSKPRSC